MRRVLEIPQLSLAERDFRWQKVREQMAVRNMECLVLWGWPTMWDFYTANARYLCPVGGNSEFNVVVFPLDGEPTCFVQMPTFLEGWRSAQNWVSDVRTRKVSWADSVAGRIRELGLESAKIGVDGLANALDPDGWLPTDVWARVNELLPDANFTGLGDMLDIIRCIKSSEEIEMLQQAARLGDAMLETCKQVAAPGVKECEVYGAMLETMLAGGGEIPTLFLWASDRFPYPHPFRLPTMRPLEPRDLIICEIHPKFGGYCTHVERTYCLGEPEPEQIHIYEVCLSAFEVGMSLFGPGNSIADSMAAVRDVVDEAGLDFCELGIHGHGLASLEYPRYRHHAINADRQAHLVIGDQFQPGMVFAFNIDLVNPNWRSGRTGCVFAETVMITADACRKMHSYPTEFQRLG